MKKFMLGMLCGMVLTATTAAYASDSIQAYLFPAKLIINGKQAEAPGQTPLNVDGSTYVPIRLISESMGAKVAYNEAEKTITIDNGLQIVDINNSEVSAGHLSIQKEDGHSIITGKLYIGYAAWNHRILDGMKSLNANEDYSKTTLTGNLVFWNREGELIERVPYEIPGAKNGAEQMVDLQTVSRTDVGDYAVVTLESHTPGPLQMVGFSTPPFVDDADRQVHFGVVSTMKYGDHTLVNSLLYADDPTAVAGDAPITITFLDEKGNSLGSASTTLGAERPMAQQSFALLVGKGDLTSYKSIAVTVGKPQKN